MTTTVNLKVRDRDQTYLAFHLKKLPPVSLDWSTNNTEITYIKALHFLDLHTCPYCFLAEQLFTKHIAHELRSNVEKESLFFIFCDLGKLFWTKMKDRHILTIFQFYDFDVVAVKSKLLYDRHLYLVFCW